MKASDGIRRIDGALAKGKDSIEHAISLFQGTVPPPPFPSPELYQAIDDAKEVRARLQTLVDAGDLDFAPELPRVKFIATQVEEKARAVEDAALKLDARRELVATRTPQEVMKTMRRKLAIPKQAVMLGIAYLLLKDEL